MKRMFSKCLDSKANRELVILAVVAIALAVALTAYL